MRKAKTNDKVSFLAPDVTTKVIPAPTDGWDAISPLAEMDPKRAPILDNWIPRPGYVEIRGGYAPFSSTLGTSPVETLMVYRSPTDEKLFAASSSKIYDVSSGIDPGTVAVSSLTNARWQYVNFTPGGGTNVIQCVNGADQLQQYNGTAWSVPVITGLPGGSSAGIININAQKRRLWYIMKNSSVAAFMATDATSGAVAGTLDLGALWGKGGYLVGMGAWTIDGGSGPQDYALFISSRGQVTIYSGVDPTDSTDWHLVGTFDISPPIGRRCMTRLGSDVAIITQQGLIPISQALPFDPSADRSVALTARIQNAMAVAALNGVDLFGWQFISYPSQQLGFLNVPLSENSQSCQFVINALTGGWCRFTGWNANCFEIYNNNLYWGGNEGQINQGYVGGQDWTASIDADMQCAYNWLDDPGRTKRMTMIQPLMTIGGTVTPTLAIDVDFEASNISAPIVTLGGTVLWDTAVWDAAVWPTSTINFKQWLSVNAIGHAMAIRMKVNINTQPDESLIGEFDVGLFDFSLFDNFFSTSIPILRVNVFNSISESGGSI